MKNKPLVICDTREKHPFDFEEDEAFAGVTHRKLDTGDYSIEGLESILIIERKASANELLSNFLTNKERFYATLERMKGIKHKFLIVEQTCENIFNPLSYHIRGRFAKSSMPPAIVFENLIKVMTEYGVHVIFAGKKAKAMTKMILLKIYNEYRCS